MKTRIISAVLSILALSAPIHPKQAASISTIYPASACVVSLDYNTDLVTVETTSGMLYQFYGTEDYTTGDLVSLLMDDNATPNNVTDDKIIDAHYSGYWVD